MLPYKRSQRVNQFLKEELADIILNRVKDPRLGFLTVTEVETTVDLKLAKVFISVLREEDKENAFEVLNSARSFIRSELGRRIKMKFTPELDFRPDTSAQYGDKIERLLREIKKEE